MDSASLLERVRRLIEKRQGIALIIPEDTGYFSIDDELVGRVRALLAEAISLLYEVTDSYDAECLARHQDEAAAGDLLLEIAAQISSEMAARELSDLAFVSRGQLREIEASLATSLRRRKIWAVASQADSGLRAAGKALFAVESAMCEYEGLQPPDRRWVDLRDSLGTRRLYGQFRRVILHSGSEDVTLAARLRRAAHRIEILRDLKIYPFLRIDDRKQIRSFQKRIAGWLEGGDGRCETDGQRLWDDLESFARLLVQVNDREELREHDRQAVRMLHRMLFRARQPPTEISEAHLEELERLVGRDDELDEIILHPGDYTVEELKPPLERIEMELELPTVRVPEGFHLPGA